MTDCYTAEATKAILIKPLTAEGLLTWKKDQPAAICRWVEVCQFNAAPKQLCYLASPEGELLMVLFGVTDDDDFWSFGGLPTLLPEHIYSIDNSDDFFSADQLKRAALAWGLGCYQFNAYLDRPDLGHRLLISDPAELDELQVLVGSIYLARDLINTPADDMGPEALAGAAAEVAHECGAKVSVTIGEHLLENNYPAIYTVGRGAAEPPRLVDVVWGNEDHPMVTLVGKGVCFDTGGLDLKPAAGMRRMKKDMGGAAHVLALARIIMLMKLPIRLRVLIAAVENAIDAKSFHPGDVIQTRAGISVEIDNTDAEGRLVLCDALAEAISESPDYVIDFATLTGAARVALGPDIAVMLSNHDQFSDELTKASHDVQDPIWRLPLYKPYRDYLRSDIADCANSSRVPLAGAITAGLFLESFVGSTTPWAHFDVYGWSDESRPGRPVGGEVCAIRAVYEFLCQRF